MIYLVKALRKHLYKIGWALNEPIRRLSDLQTPSPYDLEMLVVQNGDKSREDILHEKLGKYRVILGKKEWFELTFNELWIEYNKLLFSDMTDEDFTILNIPSDRLKKRRRDVFSIDEFLNENYEYDEANVFSVDVGLETGQIYADLLQYMKKIGMPDEEIILTTRKQLLGALSRHPCGKKSMNKRHYFNLSRASNLLA